MELNNVEEVPLKDIKVTESNVRTDLSTTESQENLEELAESIRIHGLMQPIVLRGISGQPPYEVVVGQRRFLAHQKLGKENIKAIFTGELDDTEALLLSLSENLLRQDLSYADIAKAVTYLFNHYNKDVYKIKEKLGLSVQAIRSFIKVEEQATEKIKNLLNESKISIADAKRAIDASQGDLTKADLIIDEIINLTKYEKDRAVDYAKNHKEATVDEILEDAKKPKKEETIILNLPFIVAKALRKASEDLEMDSDVITMRALRNWLVINNYLDT